MFHKTNQLWYSFGCNNKPSRRVSCTLVSRDDSVAAAAVSTRAGHARRSVALVAQNALQLRRTIPSGQAGQGQPSQCYREQHSLALWKVNLAARCDSAWKTSVSTATHTGSQAASAAAALTNSLSHLISVEVEKRSSVFLTSLALCIPADIVSRILLRSPPPISLSRSPALCHCHCCLSTASLIPRFPFRSSIPPSHKQHGPVPCQARDEHSHSRRGE